MQTSQSCQFTKIRWNPKFEAIWCRQKILDDPKLQGSQVHFCTKHSKSSTWKTELNSFRPSVLNGILFRYNMTKENPPKKFPATCPTRSFFGIPWPVFATQPCCSLALWSTKAWSNKRSSLTTWKKCLEDHPRTRWYRGENGSPWWSVVFVS